MTFRLLVSLLLGAAVSGGTPAAAQSTEPGLIISIVGSTLSGNSCHLSFQVRNRLFADLHRFVADFTARSADGTEVGSGVFAAGRIRRLQPFLRVASFEALGGDSAACGTVASVELDIQSCVLDTAGDVGAAYCRDAFRPEDHAIAVNLAGQVPDGPAEELAIGDLGVTFSTLTRSLATTHGILGTVEGVVVIGVQQPAVPTGLLEGDLVVEVDQARVPTLQDLSERVRTARRQGQKSVLCMVVRGGERHWLVARFLTVPVTPPIDPPG